MNRKQREKRNPYRHFDFTDACSHMTSKKKHPAQQLQVCDPFQLSYFPWKRGSFVFGLSPLCVHVLL
jgi:hypothetical protein